MDFKYLSYTGLKRFFYTKVQQKLDQKLDKINGDISGTKIRTLDTVSTKYPIPNTGERISLFLSKVRTFLSTIKPLEVDVTYYVATTGSDTTGDGTSAKPFKTIQHALDILPKDLGSCMASIIIANGTYNEDVKVKSFTNGSLQIYSTTPKTISSNVKISSILCANCSCVIDISGVEITSYSDFFGAGSYSSIAVTACTNVVAQSTRIISSIGSEIHAVHCTSGCMFRLLSCEISNRRFVLVLVDSSGYINNCTGTNNGNNASSIGCSVLHLLNGQASSTYGNYQDQGGMIILHNGTQISDIISAGLSCAWGTFSGGYTRHGNPSYGAAMVTVQIRVVLNTPLTAGSTYLISGFPKPKLDICCAISNLYYPGNCYINVNNGSLTYIPINNVSAGIALVFSATYLTEQ